MSRKSNWIRKSTRLAVYLRDDLTCLWCTRSYWDGATLTLDHLDPTVNAPLSLVTACWTCNSAGIDARKSTREVKARLGKARGRTEKHWDAYRQQALLTLRLRPSWYQDLLERTIYARTVAAQQARVPMLEGCPRCGALPGPDVADPTDPTPF